MMFPGSRSCINLVSRVVRLLTHIDDARAYIVPYLHRRFIPRHLAPTVGLSARGFTIRWVKSSSTTAASSSPHRSSDSDVKVFIHKRGGSTSSLPSRAFDLTYKIRKSAIVASSSTRLHKPASYRLKSPAVRFKINPEVEDVTES